MIESMSVLIIWAMANSLLGNYGGAHGHERNSNFSPGSEFRLRHTKQFVVHEGHNQTSAGDHYRAHLGVQVTGAAPTADEVIE
jgi:hypothetical protein